MINNHCKIYIVFIDLIDIFQVVSNLPEANEAFENQIVTWYVGWLVVDPIWSMMTSTAVIRQKAKSLVEKVLNKAENVCAIALCLWQRSCGHHKCHIQKAQKLKKKEKIEAIIV